jgi:tRNA 2-selenouridine synthase
MSKSPLIILETDVDERVNNVFNEYITESLRQHQAIAGKDKGFEAWHQIPQMALDKIQRRLGGVRYKELKTIMQDALKQHRQLGDPEPHKEWIRTLLLEYYDPMYDYQLSKKSERIIYRGDRDSVIEFLEKEFGLV